MGLYLYLLLHLLILSIVESQTSNITHGRVEERLMFQLSNHTYMDNSTMSRNNGTLSYDELTEIEAELNKQSNQSVITDDNEKFQTWEDEQPYGQCQAELLLVIIHMDCSFVFDEKMSNLTTENWCVLEDVIRPYYDMTKCVEYWSTKCHCFYPNQHTQGFFIDIHSFYFHNCPMEEFELEDAPQWLVLTLTIIPVSFIPVLVYLVVQKSKEQE